jgi:hypothetical protein
MALCKILCSQVQALHSSPGLCIITQKVGDLVLIGDSSTGTFRPLVPRDLRRQEDKVSTLRLKPCTDHTAQPIVRGRLPATICFWDFWEPFSPGQPPGVFAHPADVLDNAAARPARNRRAPTRLDL